MRHVLAVIVLCACGGTRRVAVENRGGTASTGCELPARLEFEARRYGNLDADDPDYQVWSSWRVGIQFGATRAALAAPDRIGADAYGDPPPASTDTPRAFDKARVHGTLAMHGDELTWTFDLAGTIDQSRCRVDLTTDTHETFWVEVDLRKRTGTIRSIDDVWLLGPPFPAKR